MKTEIARMHYANYTTEEWSIMQLLCTHLGIPYRTRHGYTTGYIEAIIVCTDEVLMNMEDVVAHETIQYA